MFIEVDEKYPKGSVLMFTFGILILVALMGAAVMVTTRGDLRTSIDTSMGRDAFSKANATAQIATIIGRVILNPAGGTPAQIINNRVSLGDPVFSVELDPSLKTFFDFYQLGDFTDVNDIRQRYLQATQANPGLKPHVTVRYGDQIVGTAHLAVARVVRDGGPPRITHVYLVVSANGRIPEFGSGSNAVNYYNEDDKGAVHSVISTVYREVVVSGQ